MWQRTWWLKKMRDNMLDGKETNLRTKEYLNTYKCEWHV